VFAKPNKELMSNFFYIQCSQRCGRIQALLTVVMNKMEQRLRVQLLHLSRQWIEHGLPSREKVTRAAADLEQWKHRRQVQGLWLEPPRMITTTLDDGLGLGLILIERFAGIMGISFDRMGLVQKPKAIVARCQTDVPDFLGLTVLQLDSDDALEFVGRSLPEKTCLIAGGTAFRLDPELAVRCRVDFVAKNVAHFIHFILDRFT